MRVSHLLAEKGREVWSIEADQAVLAASMPRCRTRHARRLLVPCFSSSHSPGPPNFNPVLSTSSCSGPPFGQSRAGSFTVRARRPMVE